VNPPDLSLAWKQLNDFLDIPFVATIGVPLALALLSLLIPKVRDVGLNVLQATWSRTRRTIRKIGEVAQQYLLAACRKLGLATREDLAAYATRDDLANLKGVIPASVPASQKEWPRPSSIERLGVMFALGEGIWSSLGKKDPALVDENYIPHWLQGPFCRNCFRSLHDTGQFDGHVSGKCPYCSLSWTKGDVYEKDLKNEVYQQLDAEFRLKGGISSSDRVIQEMKFSETDIQRMKGLKRS
jgi:hypothetical protein